MLEEKAEERRRLRAQQMSAKQQSRRTLLSLMHCQCHSCHSHSTMCIYFRRVDFVGGERNKKKSRWRTGNGLCFCIALSQTPVEATRPETPGQCTACCICLRLPHLKLFGDSNLNTKLCCLNDDRSNGVQATCLSFFDAALLWLSVECER